jgi:hypothetical protein
MRRASDILSKLLDENSRGKARGYASVFRDWRDLAGLSLADHSRVYEIKHNNLFVEVDHNGWMQILLLRKGRILRQLRGKFPELEIRDIKVRVNPSLALEQDDRQRESAEVTSVPVTESPTSNEGEVERIVSRVEQESLKRQLKKLFLSSLKNKREQQ